MCAPLLGAIVGVMQAAVSFSAAQQEYQAKAAAWQNNYVNALAAGRDDFRQGTLRQMQEQDATTQKIHETNVEEAKKVASAEVQAAQSGISGVSVANIIADIHGQAGANRATLKANYDMKAIQLQSEKEAAVNKEISRINSVERPVSPNPAAFFVQALGAGVKAFGSSSSEGSGGLFSFA